jgi:hypothetical protein
MQTDENIHMQEDKKITQKLPPLIIHGGKREKKAR